jgi:hypothetical protein
MRKVDHPLPLLGHRQWAQQHIDLTGPSGREEILNRGHLHEGCFGADSVGQFTPEIN